MLPANGDPAYSKSMAANPVGQRVTGSLSSNMAGLMSHSRSASQSAPRKDTSAKQNMLILDRALTKTKSTETGLSAFAFLFSEIISYSQKKVKTVSDLETKFYDHGNRVGERLFELITTIWKTLFDKTADGLEKSTENEDEYMIIDNEPVVSKFISVPKDLQNNLNCASFVAGIVGAIMQSALFHARVTAHTVPEENLPLRTVILIKVDKSVLEREAQMAS